MQGGLNANGPITIAGIGHCTPALGMMQWNVDNSQFEWWDGAVWQPFGEVTETTLLELLNQNQQLQLRIKALEEKEIGLERLTQLEKENKEMRGEIEPSKNN